jgi:hypothetical protein
MEGWPDDTKTCFLSARRWIIHNGWGSFGLFGRYDTQLCVFTCIRPLVSARNRRREIYILLCTKLSPATLFFSYLRKVMFTN